MGVIREATALELIKELNELDESEDLEAKECTSAIGKSVYETICALSNEPGLTGGTILLGVDKEEALFPFYSAIGVSDPDKLSGDLASACSIMFNQPVRIDINREIVGEAVVLKIDVPELPINQKPLYFKSAGLPGGAYRRVGSSDIKCTDEDIQAFFQGKVNDPYDSRIVRDARWDDIDPAAITAYRRARAEANPLAEELNWSDEDMLHALGAIRRLDGNTQITTSGLLVFGRSASIRRFFPSHRVDYIRIPGKIWVQNPDEGFDALDTRGPIVLIIGRLLAAITDDLPKTFVIGDGLTGQRTETSVVPVRVIREALVNALMHRSYEVFQPIQIVRYANRIVIKNPGYSLKSQDRFAEPGSYIRNPTIAEVLHETRFAETKGSGIRVMQEKMKLNGLAPPTFESDREGQEFSATFLFHHFLDEADWGWLAQFTDLGLSEDQMRALIFVREVGAIDNSSYRNVSQLDTLAASKSLRNLVNIGLLKGRGSGAKTHYVAGAELNKRDTGNAPKPVSMHAKSDNMDASRHGNQADLSLAAIPIPLRFLVRASHLKGRLSPAETENLIIRLCDWKPLSVVELASFLDKRASYLAQKYVTPMVARGILRYEFPEMPQHPQQRYLTAALSDRS